MITEVIVALIWASVSSYFFYAVGWREIVSPEQVNDFMAQVELADGKTLIQYFTAPQVVKLVCTGWLGVFGGMLAILGVVAAPITSGDTALRSGRLIIAEALKLKQKGITQRLVIAVPMFAATFALLLWQMNNPSGFKVLWQYFGWSNQTLSVFTLWTLTVYLSTRGRWHYWITLVPAVVMTAVCTTFIVVSPEALNLNQWLAWPVAAVVVVLSLALFFVWRRRYNLSRA